MYFAREDVRRFVGRGTEQLEVVYDRLEELDREIDSDSESPSILLEPFVRPDHVTQLAVTEASAEEYFLSLGYDEKHAGVEARTITGRLVGHQLRLRSLKAEHFGFQRIICGCPIQSIGIDAIDPMSFIVLGQMPSAGIAEHFAGYRMGLRRARSIKKMAARIIDDIM